VGACHKSHNAPRPCLVLGYEVIADDPVLSSNLSHQASYSVIAFHVPSLCTIKHPARYRLPRYLWNCPPRKSPNHRRSTHIGSTKEVVAVVEGDSFLLWCCIDTTQKLEYIFLDVAEYRRIDPVFCWKKSRPRR
jgi:hypothetical protein